MKKQNKENLISILLWSWLFVGASGFNVYALVMLARWVLG